MDIPKRPTPFAKLIDLGVHGQVMVCVTMGDWGAAVMEATNAILEGDAPVSYRRTVMSYEAAAQVVAEYDEDDARAFIAQVTKHMTYKIGEKA